MSAPSKQTQKSDLLTIALRKSRRTENVDSLREYTERRMKANAFDLRYAGDVMPKGERWELCEKVLARHDVKQRLSRGWGERDRAEPA